MRPFLFLSVLSVLLIPSAYGVTSDKVVLNSGEVIQCQIILETDAQIEVEIANDSRTIFTKRSILKSDIKTIERETPEQKAERAAYEALAKYKLDANREFSTSYYSQAITDFDRFLSSYPQSASVPDVQKRFSEWKEEKSHAEMGQVKFANKWMTPEEKKPLVEQWQKESNVQLARKTLESLNTQLANLDAQRGSLAENLSAAQGKLTAAKTALKNLEDTREPIYNTTTSPFQPHWDSQGRWVVSGPAKTTKTLVGYRTVPNPQKQSLQNDVASYQGQVTQGQITLAALDAKMVSARLQIQKSEQDYKLTLARLSETPAKPPVIVAASPPPPPTPLPPAPPPLPPQTETPWYEKYWKWITAGVFLLGLMYLVGRIDAWRST